MKNLSGYDAHYNTAAFSLYIYIYSKQGNIEPHSADAATKDFVINQKLYRLTSPLRSGSEVDELW